MAERITQNTDVTIIPSRTGDRGVATRNSLGRVYVEDGEAFEVIVRTPTDETVAAKGAGKAEVGKLCSIYIKVRAEADVSAPVIAEEPE